VVTIASDGTVEVYVRANVSEGLNTIAAPAEPVPATIDARINGTELVPIVYSDGMFYVVAGTPGFVVISYMANTTVYDDGSLGFKILNVTTALVVRPGIVLLSLPEKIYSAEYVKGSLKLVVGGPARIRYVLVEEATTTTPPTTTTAQQPPAATTTTTTAPPPTTTTGPAIPPETTLSTASQAIAQESTTEKKEGPGIVLWVGVLVVVAIVSIGLGYFLTVRRSSGGGGARVGADIASTELDETDKLILDTLVKHGGSMLQSELLRDTGLPKTTLWRHVRKLERLGYIRIVREGRVNRLILARKPQQF
jgi:uncharacterized membrane protein